MCPSTGPLLHGLLTADSTALRSCFKVRTNRSSERISVLRASSIQRWRVVTFTTTQEQKYADRMLRYLPRFSISVHNINQQRFPWPPHSSLPLPYSPRHRYTREMFLWSLLQKPPD